MLVMQARWLTAKTVLAIDMTQHMRLHKKAFNDLCQMGETVESLLMWLHWWCRQGG